MNSNQTKCFRCVGDIPDMIKYEKTKSGNMRVKYCLGSK